MTPKIPSGWKKTECPTEKHYFCALVCIAGDLKGQYDCRGLSRCDGRKELEKINIRLMDKERPD